MECFNVHPFLMAQTQKEKNMSRARYYVVGDHDVWMVNVKDSEPNQPGSHNQAVAIAIGAAQRLGMRGERAHVCEMDDDGRFRCRWTYNQYQYQCRKMS
jgi:hypothetical protein